MFPYFAEIPRYCHPEQREPLGRWPIGKSKDLAQYVAKSQREMLRIRSA